MTIDSTSRLPMPAEKSLVVIDATRPVDASLGTHKATHDSIHQSGSRASCTARLTGNGNLHSVTFESKQEAKFPSSINKRPELVFAF